MGVLSLLNYEDSIMLDANVIFLLIACIPSGYAISRPIVGTLRRLGVAC